MDYIYKGFSSKQYQHNKSYIMTDIELVKEDLVNHIFTRKGERVRMANFGTLIPELIFEPLDEIVINQIGAELNTVFTYDPRVELVDMVIIPYYEDKAIVALVDLIYVELATQDRLSLRLEFQS
jgi:Phage baseplate assembly protein W